MTVITRIRSMRLITKIFEKITDIRRFEKDELHLMQESKNFAKFPVVLHNYAYVLAGLERNRIESCPVGKVDNGE